MLAADGVQGGSASTGKTGSKQQSSSAGTEFAKAVETQKEATVQEHNQGDTAPDTAPNNVTLTTVRSGGTDLVEDTAAQVADGAGDEDRPASDGTNGKTEHVVRDGETLESIAEDHGQTVDDVLLANPEMTETTTLEEGDVVAIYDETRLEIAREIATTTDPVRLNQLVMDEMLYATEHSSTPADLLPAVQRDILARRDGDAQFGAIVEERGAAATTLWQNQGRTHEVMDPLFEMAAQGDSAGLQQQIVGIFDAVATGTPTQEAVNAQRDYLLAYGPQDPVFVEALNAAETYFNTGRPQEVAAEVAAAYVEHGPVVAAELLANRTTFGNADPLTAARILAAAEPTVSQIITHLGFGGWHEWQGNPAGGNFYIDPGLKEAVFADLSAAADNASLAAESAGTISTMASAINAQGFGYVSRSIIDGSGVVLPLEMLAQSGDPSLAGAITVGIEQLQARINESVTEFAQTAYPVTGPAMAWSGLVEDPETAFQAALDVVRADGTTVRDALNADIVRLNEDGRQMMRVILGMEQYASRLGAFPDLLAAGARPAEGSAPAIELVLGSDGALLEATRFTNIQNLANGQAINPYAVASSGGFLARMVGNTARSYAVANLGMTRPEFAPSTGLGLGLGLYRLGTYGVGYAANSTRTAWRSQVLTGLNAAGVVLEGASALSGIFAPRNLIQLTPSQIEALPFIDRQLALAATGARDGILGQFMTWHLRAFGIFNLVSGVDSLANGAHIQGFASIAAGAGTLMAAAPETVGGIISMAAPRVVLMGNVITLIASGVLVVNAIHEANVARAELEATHVAYLEAAGVDPEVAQIVVDIDQGQLAAPAMQALSDYLNLAPGELLETLAAYPIDDVMGFHGWMLQTLHPDENGQFPATDWDEEGMTPYPLSLEDVIAGAANFNIVLPDHRGEQPQS
jgi:hypothetical protein